MAALDKSVSRPHDLDNLAMRPVAPGPWTDLVVGEPDVEFDITRTDRIDVEFSQDDRECQEFRV